MQIFPRKLLESFEGSVFLVQLTRFSKLLLSRIIDVVAEYCGPTQNGFLTGRSTADVVACVRRLMDSSVEFHSGLFLKLVDFSKAFDKVNRSAIRIILLNCGIDFRLVHMIYDLLSDTTVAVKVRRRKSRQVPVKMGVRQGCPISPCLFIVVLAFLVHSCASKFPSLFHWEYADDLTLIAESKPLVEDAFAYIASAGEPLGLIVNHNKTENFEVLQGLRTSKGKKKVRDKWIS